MQDAVRLDRAHSWGSLVALILACQLVGFLGAQVTDPSFYAELERPGWAPPGWLFAPVWIALYTIMAVAAWLVWRTGPGRERTAALIAFGIQLTLNAAWSPVFFGMRSLGGGLIVIAALNLAIWTTIVLFERRSQVAAGLMVPYALWVGFATALNATLWRLSA